MRLNLAYDAGEGRRAVTATPADLAAWEKKHRKPFTKLAEEPYVGEWAWLAWHVSKRVGHHELSTDAFLEQLVEVEPGGEPETPTSGRGAPSGD